MKFRFRPRNKQLTPGAPWGVSVVHSRCAPFAIGDPMPKPRATKDRLIETAGDLFYTTGFQAVGLDQILRTVGITKTAFYKHFESKDDLILAVLDRRDRQDIVEAIAQMQRRGGRDPRAQILVFFDLLAE